MPLQGTFAADFSSFVDACAKAELSLRSFDTASGKVETSLNRMGDAFSGRNMIQQATLAADAVDKIGGVSQLTANELQKLGAQADQAIAKMQARGITNVPPQLQAISDAAHAAEGGLGAMTGQFLQSIPVVGQFLAALSVEGLIAFGKSSIDLAYDIENLAAATGIGADALQRMNYVGADFGLGIDQLARGVEQFSAKLANGDKNAVFAVESLGLSVKSLLAAGPEEAFLRFADAAGRVEDQMSKSGLATDALGGRLAKVLLPALGDLRTAMQQVPDKQIIPDADIQAAHDFDAWINRSVIDLKAFAAEIATLPFNIFEAYKEVLKPVTEEELQATKGAEGFYNSQINVGGSLTTTTSNAQLLQQWLQSLRTAGYEPLTQVQKDIILEAEKLGATQEEIASRIGVTAAAVKLYTDTYKQGLIDQKKAAEDAARAERELADGEKLVATTAADAVAAGVALNKARLDDRLRLTQLQQGYDEQYYKQELEAGKITEAQYSALVIANRRALAQQIDTIAREEEQDALASLDAQEEAKRQKVEAEYDTGRLDYELYQQALTQIHDEFEKKRDTVEEQYDEKRRERELAQQQAQSQAYVQVKSTAVSSFEAMSEASAALNGDLNSNTANVLTLAGAFITAKKAKDEFDQGNSITYDLSSDQGLAYFKKLNPAASIGWSDAQIEAFIQKGGSLAQLIQMGVINQYAGYGGLPGYATGVENAPGGLAIVGEKGPEIVRLPTGADVFPTVASAGASIGGGSGGGSATLTVNGVIDASNRQALARMLAQELFQLTGRKFELH